MHATSVPAAVLQALTARQRLRPNSARCLTSDLGVWNGLCFVEWTLLADDNGHPKRTTLGDLINYGSVECDLPASPYKNCCTDLVFPATACHKLVPPWKRFLPAV